MLSPGVSGREKPKDKIPLNYCNSSYRTAAFSPLARVSYAEEVSFVVEFIKETAIKLKCVSLLSLVLR